MLAGMLDFAAYLERIGLSVSERPTLQDIHRAHATSIPFENLDRHRRIPVSLAQEDLERKLVHERRGGYVAAPDCGGRPGSTARGPVDYAEQWACRKLDAL
jgi:N-acetyltransferase